MQQELYDECLNLIGGKTRERRREFLNDRMDQLIKEGKDCFSCIGHCCTFEFNSMQVDVLQAFDMYSYLISKERVNAELIERLEKNISEFRLDKELLTRGRQQLRRYYTCPFYSFNSLGCSLSRHSKPYGCLAFNPLKQKVSSTGHCESSVEDLSKREELYFESEKELNHLLSEKLLFPWEKVDISRGLLYLIKLFKSDSSL